MSAGLSSDCQVIANIGASGYATQVEARGHALQADESAGAGGTDTGPTPYDLLLASLGTCTAMTLRMYAAGKGWPMTGVTVGLDQDRTPAKDCQSETGLVLRITKRIEMTGDLDEQQRARLLEIADRCPAHRSLLSETKIVTE